MCRVSEDLVGPQEAAGLWGVALRSLKGSLEAAFETQLHTAPQMLMVKEFVVLMCVALERAGHQVTVCTWGRGAFKQGFSSRWGGGTLFPECFCSLLILNFQKVYLAYSPCHPYHMTCVCVFCVPLPPPAPCVSP